MPTRLFLVNLDDEIPEAVPFISDLTQNKPELPPTFPFKVSDSDPEYFNVEFSTPRCDCRFRLELDWVADGRRGTTTIDDHGKPFRVVGNRDLPEYIIDNNYRLIPRR